MIGEYATFYTNAKAPAIAPMTTPSNFNPLPTAPFVGVDDELVGEVEVPDRVTEIGGGT